MLGPALICVLRLVVEVYTHALRTTTHVEAGGRKHDVLPAAWLDVGGRQKAGDLVLDSIALGDTILGRFALATVPAPDGLSRRREPLRIALLWRPPYCSFQQASYRPPLTAAWTDAVRVGLVPHGYRGVTAV